MQDIATRLVDALPEAAVVRRQPPVSSTAGTLDPGVDRAAPSSALLGEERVVPNEMHLNIPNRLAALEVWAHSFDSVHVADDGDSSCALTRASELVGSLVQQAVRDYFHENPIAFTAAASEQPPMSAPAATGLQVNEFMLADKIKKLEEQLMVLEAKVTAVSSVTVFASPDPSPASGADHTPAQTWQVQHDQLMKMHTDAISRTWQWTSSVILAMMQQRSTNLHVQQSLAALDERIATMLASAPSGVSQLASLSAATAMDPASAEATFVPPQSASYPQVPVVAHNPLQELDSTVVPSIPVGMEQVAMRDVGAQNAELTEHAEPIEQPSPSHSMVPDESPMVVVPSDSD
eukprot:3925412-Amphidinium_carterae.2